jgi:hypothetical protein
MTLAQSLMRIFWEKLKKFDKKVPDGKFQRLGYKVG